MANYVIVNTKIGKWLTFYPWGEVTTKAEAVEIAKEYNEREGVNYFQAMPEMEYYRTYDPKLFNLLKKFKEEEAKAKAERARIRASRKAFKEKQEAKKSKWLPGGILNFH